MAAIQAQEIIGHAAIFRHVPAQQRAALARAARLRHARRGETIFHRGDSLEGLLIVGQGMIKLALRSGSGVERILRLVGQGGTFGEAVLFLERPVPVDAVAVVDSTLVSVPTAELLRLIDGDSRFARAMLAGLAQRIHSLVSDFEAATMHGAAARAAAYLESLAPEGPGPLVVRLPASKTLIASRLGMTKETFSRILHELSTSGLIRVRKLEISLLDRPRLHSLGQGTGAPAGSE